jgi:hypothetical protein
MQHRQKVEADFCRHATSSRSPVIGSAYAFVCVACSGRLFWHIGGLAGLNLTNKRLQEAAWRRVPANSVCVVWRAGTRGMSFVVEKKWRQSEVRAREVPVLVLTHQPE